MDEIEHHIEKSILRVLTLQETARFSEMRPSNIDSNLYAYHLKKLVKSKLIDKSGQDYKLSNHGLSYVDRISIDSFKRNTQPKITTSIVVKNNKGEILLTKRTKQPFISKWSLPMGKIHLGERNIAQSASRELQEKTSLIEKELRHIGDCYIRTYDQGFLISSLLTHVFATQNPISLNALPEGLRWFNQRTLKHQDIIPGVAQIAKLSSSPIPHFFEELELNI